LPTTWPQARIDAAAEQAHLIDTLADGLKNLAEGDLTFRLGDFPEAYRQIRDDFNGAMTGLQETIKALMTVTREVTNATAEISASTTDLS
jgi:methyl-accepting chemotaxis protein